MRKRFTILVFALLGYSNYMQATTAYEGKNDSTILASMQGVFISELYSYNFQGKQFIKKSNKPEITTEILTIKGDTIIEKRTFKCENEHSSCHNRPDEITKIFIKDVYRLNENLLILLLQSIETYDNTTVEYVNLLSKDRKKITFEGLLWDNGLEDSEGNFQHIVNRLNSLDVESRKDTLFKLSGFTFFPIYGFNTYYQEKEYAEFAKLEPLESKDAISNFRDQFIACCFTSKDEYYLCLMNRVQSWRLKELGFKPYELNSQFHELALRNGYNPFQAGGYYFESERYSKAYEDYEKSVGLELVKYTFYLFLLYGLLWYLGVPVLKKSKSNIVNNLGVIGFSILLGIAVGFIVYFPASSVYKGGESIGMVFFVLVGFAFGGVTGLILGILKTRARKRS